MGQQSAVWALELASWAPGFRPATGWLVLALNLPSLSVLIYNTGGIKVSATQG